MPFSIIRNDITKMQVDAVVNSANPQPVIGEGVDGAIHAAAGPKLLEKRRRIGALAVGQAAISRGYDLPAKYVIHTVGPVWRGGEKNERELLRMCYLNALELAHSRHCASVAFPLISAGVYGFPRGEAMQIALAAISEFLLRHEMMVWLVVYDAASFAVSEKLFDTVRSYIDARMVEEEEKRKKARYEARVRRVMEANGSTVEEIGVFSAAMPMPLAASEMMPSAEKTKAPQKKKRSLDDLMKNVEETFSGMLLRLIDEKGMKDSDVYKRANIDRKLFSKIRTNPEYHPKKQTALALAVALRLNLDETKDLLLRAGFALSPSSKFDIILEYFITEENYDIFEINEVLFAFEQPLIGG